MAPSQTASLRRPFIDWARGLAVLVMIEAHTVDAWTRTADRHSRAFGYLLLVGGYAAPLFLWLAGLGTVMSGEAAVRRGRSRAKAAEALVSRGAEIFILAFLFRLQAFIVSPGSYPVTLFRVDILNVMGPAIAAAGLLWAVARTPGRALAFNALAAVAVAMLTPIVRTVAWVGVLPVWVQWYLRPSGDNTTFTMLPWVGFVFAGAACGVLVARAQDSRTEQRTMSILALAAAVVSATGFYTATLPTIYQSSAFWTSSPTYFAIRTGIMMVVLCACWAVALWVPETNPVMSRLAVLGRNSLFVYWIHVELVYGYATWLIHGRLPVWAVALAYALFVVLMYHAIALRDAVVRSWRGFRGRKSAAPAATPARV